jgi:predicted O-methyltransferase YrrM
LKWLLQNVRRRAAFAIKNPRYATSAFLRELTFADEKFISRMTGVPHWKIRAYMDEPISTPEFASLLRDAATKMRRLTIESADVFAKKILLQYASIRALNPLCVVETGIANGVSSSYLLFALRKNGRGRLHSVGLSDASFLPNGVEPGWLVPSWLRGSWEVHLGDARQILPFLLPHLGSIDVFIHDSLHTYEHMFWEFERAYASLRSGGLLLADDALWNTAFYDFSRKARASDAQVLHGVGFLRKD